jgi:hypothetical protein
MPLINGCNFEQTTLQKLVEAAEQAKTDEFDLVHLSLDSGKELILLAIVGENLDSVGMILDGVRDLQNARGAN